MANRIPQEFINQILSRTDIIELMQARIKLTRRGQNHHGLCPFHQEKTPSFTANQSKQFYYCFGCGASGNAIGFIMQYDQLEFRDAVEYLANQLGLELPTDSSDEKAGLYKELYAIMAEASHFYQQHLRTSSIAKDYLINRGLTGEIAKIFNIGFIPDGWNQLSQQFPTQKQQELLSQAGMLKHKSERCYDTFRHRIMFPIRNVRGHVVGFGGRSIDQSPPKYLNSPETLIFHKNEELYGLYEAKQANTKCTRLIVVEGYMDVISLHQFGITQAVATLGTAINRHHIQKLLRYCNHIVFCFDGDRAGRQAAWKALSVSLPFLQEGICFQFYNIPEGEDPDSLVRTMGRDLVEKQITASPQLTTMLFEELHRKYDGNDLSAQASFAKEAMTLINTMPACIYRELLIEQLAQEIHLEKSQIEPLLQQPEPKPLSTEPTEAQITPNQRIMEVTFPLSPTLVVAAIIIQHPHLISHLAKVSINADSSLERDWLLYIIKIIKENKISTTYEIFNLIKTQNHPALAQLAGHDFALSESALELELMGALERMQEQQYDQTAQRLIEKAKRAPLSTAEKAQLNDILNLKNKKLLDQTET